jgi:hypothetical protein
LDPTFFKFVSHNLAYHYKRMQEITKLRLT